MDKKALYKLSYGLFVLTAKDGIKDNGCIINTAIQAASDPLTISICVNKANYTHDMIMKTKMFNVSVLSTDATFDTFKHYGFQTGKDVNKMLAYGDWARAVNDVAYVTRGTNAYLSCYVIQTVDLGSHTMFIATVTDSKVLSDAPSMTYEYYMANVKPKPEKKVTQEGKTVWVCTICGYVYEGDELPEDYICPLCKHPASDFEKKII